MTKITNTRKLKTAATASATASATVTTTQRPWTRDEVERIIVWIEDHEEAIQGKQVQWHKEVKAQVFADEEHILVKRITEKMMPVCSNDFLCCTKVLYMLFLLHIIK